MGGSNDSTLRNWSQAATAEVNGQYELRILGGPQDQPVHIGTQVEGGRLAMYDEDVEKRCAFWNRLEVLEQLAV